MEKLIKLLNEYEAKRHKTSIVADIREQKEDNLSYLEMNWNYSELLCISKGYEFIKRLVDNDKIDFELDRIIHRHKGIDYNTGKGIAVEKLCDKYESLLMLLSIQDKPIEFLCSVLK